MKRNPERTMALLRALARRLWGPVSLAELGADTATGSTTGGEHAMGLYAVRSGVSALRAAFILEESRAFTPGLGTATPVRTTPTCWFADPSIAAVALGVGPEGLLRDRGLFERLFRNLAVRDLRVYGEAFGAEVRHYRDKTGLTCDVVICRRNGSFGLVNVVLGGEKTVEDAVRRLKRLEAKLPRGAAGPALMMVVTGGEPCALRRGDGVCVVPVGCLNS